MRVGGLRCRPSKNCVLSGRTASQGVYRQVFNIVILGLVSFFTDVSSEMVYPLIPLFLTGALGATPAIVGVIEGIAESLASLLKVFAGYASDRSGRRKPLAVFGYGSAAVGKILLLVASSWWWVLAARVVDRFGKGIRTAPRDAIIADSSAQGERGKAYGLHRALDTAGAVLGVLLAYYFMTAYRGDFTLVFATALIPAAVGVAFLALVREQARRGEQARRSGQNQLGEQARLGEQAPSPAPSPAGIASVPAHAANRWAWWWTGWKSLDPRLKAFLVVTFFFTLGNSSNQFLLLRAQNLGMPASRVILLYLVYNLVYSAVSYPIGRLSDLIGRRGILVVGYLFYGLVYLGFGLVRDTAALWALFAVYGLYIGFTEGVEKALVADIAPARQKATLIGLHATLVGIGLLPASILAGQLWRWFGAAAPFYFGGAVGLAAALALWIVLAGEGRPNRAGRNRPNPVG